MNPLLIVLLIFAVLVIAFIGLYNSLIRDSNLVKEAWSGIDVQLKRRHDLLTKLIDTVKGATNYEKSTLESVIALRNQSMSAKTVSERSAAEGQLSAGIGKLFALSENYPNLKANDSFVELQKNMADVENDLQSARRYYNGAARNYNIRIATFPSVFVANAFQYKPADYFMATDAEREDVKVNL